MRRVRIVDHDGIKATALATLALAELVLVSACGPEAGSDLPRMQKGTTAPAGADVDLVMWRGVPGNPPVFDLVAVRFDGSALGPLAGMPTREGVRPRLFDRPAWSPDGTAVAFTVDLSEPHGEGGFPKTAIYVVEADGSGLRRLTREGLSGSPVWSPDGRTIAYARRAAMEEPRSLAEYLRKSVTLWTMTADGDCYLIHSVRASVRPVAVSAVLRCRSRSSH